MKNHDRTGKKFEDISYKSDGKYKNIEWTNWEDFLRN